VRATVDDGDQVLDTDEDGDVLPDSDNEWVSVSVKDELWEMLNTNVKELDGEVRSVGVEL